jgi:hypothetical protein
MYNYAAVTAAAVASLSAVIVAITIASTDACCCVPYQSESCFFRISKILSAAEALWTRDSHKTASSSDASGSGIGISNSSSSGSSAGAAPREGDAFPFSVRAVVEAETCLLKAFGYNCALISRPDKV